MTKNTKQTGIDIRTPMGWVRVSEVRRTRAGYLIGRIGSDWLAEDELGASLKYAYAAIK